MFVLVDRPLARAGKAIAVARQFDTTLPIDAALPALGAALAGTNSAVLVAPPGAGKTTRVPLVLLEQSWAKDKKILVLEPRRLAARAAAARMAATLGEQVGDTVGLRVRFGGHSANADRGGDRRHFHAPCHRRSITRRRCCGTVRRISRALAGCRSRARAGTRLAAGAAARPQAAGHVGHARRRAGRSAAG